MYPVNTNFSFSRLFLGAFLILAGLTYCGLAIPTLLTGVVGIIAGAAVLIGV